MKAKIAIMATAALLAVGVMATSSAQATVPVKAKPVHYVNVAAGYTYGADTMKATALQTAYDIQSGQMQFEQKIIAKTAGALTAKDLVSKKMANTHGDWALNLKPSVAGTQTMAEATAVAYRPIIAPASALKACFPADTTAALVAQKDIAASAPIAAC